MCCHYTRRTWDGRPTAWGLILKQLAILTMLLAASSPLLAQLYSYEKADGRIVITDRPIDRDGYKLVKKFIPKEKREQQRRRSRSRSSGKFLTPAQIDGLVTPIATAMSVDPELVKAVINIESSRDPRAHSHKGAIGLMQLIPATAERFGVDNPWDPRQNIRGGILYLRYLLSYFEGNVDYVLAAYNAGENAVDRYHGIPPYKETRRYVQKVRKLYDAKFHPYGDAAKRRSKLVARKASDSAVSAQ